MASYPSNLNRLKLEANAREAERARRRLAVKLRKPLPGLENHQGMLTRRWATVSNVNEDGTVQLVLDGQPLVDENDGTGLSVAVMSRYSPTAGDTVMVDHMGHDLVVVDTILADGDVPVGAILDYLTWPGATTDVTAAGGAHAFITQALPVVAGHSYLVTVRWVYTIVTAVPTAVTAQITDSAGYLAAGNGSAEYIYSANTSANATGNVLEGAGSTVLQAAASTVDTVGVTVTVTGPGAARTTLLTCDFVVVRVA